VVSASPPRPSSLPPGQPPELGVRWNGSVEFPAVTVAVPVGHTIEQLEFCVFKPDGTERRYALRNRLGNVVWDFIEGIAPGTLYGLRATGHGCDPHQLLVDPYARAITGPVDWLSRPGSLRVRVAGTNAAQLAGAPQQTKADGGVQHASSDTSLDTALDTAPDMPRCVVIDPTFDWGPSGINRPYVAWTDTVIYEAHVKSTTYLHESIPESLRGTYAGLAHPEFIAHLTHIGVTTLELLPVHHHVDEERLAHLGLVNLWGYNTLGFFAPDSRYSASGNHGEQVAEFKGMVKLLHQAGIEVVLDVVYNHSGEGGPDGAVHSLRGLDPHGWYRQPDVTGCGNTIDMRQPAALRLVLDSLRYWVEECGVDGFRFDLAPAMCRGDFGFSTHANFLSAIAADPVLNRVKLISEPWDIGMGGYQLGGFPAPWAEWNDRYRDTVRDLWRGVPQPLGEVAARLAGSSDLFGPTRRAPWASINFVAAHDGMGVNDLCTYNHKHNEANGEQNRDGTDNNRSWNCGVEGPTDDAAINQLRHRQRRNLLATLLLSQGTPMFLAGDELGHTQQGNNNAYCQDNEISWVNWAAADKHLVDFVAQLTSIRRNFSVFRRDTWMADGHDAQWFAPDASPMSIGRWNDPESAGLTLRLAGTPDVILVLNDAHYEQTFSLPPGNWQLLLCTDDSQNPAAPQSSAHDHTHTCTLTDRCLAVFVEVPAASENPGDNPGENSDQNPEKTQ
jgi:isoamylase